MGAHDGTGLIAPHEGVLPAVRMSAAVLIACGIPSPPAGLDQVGDVGIAGCTVAARGQV